jgi:hypothetical protein
VGLLIGCGALVIQAGWFCRLLLVPSGFFLGVGTRGWGLVGLGALLGPEGTGMLCRFLVRDWSGHYTAPMFFVGGWWWLGVGFVRVLRTA